MEIFNDKMKAFDGAMRRFLRQTSDDPVYICRATVARREFWTVLSSTELKENKISAKSCWTSVTGQHGLLEYKHRVEKEKPDAKTRLQIKSMRGLRQYYQAEEKLEKMDRDTQSVKRSVEVSSDSDQIADPSSL